MDWVGQLREEIAYDGSGVSRAAVRSAAELFAGRPAVLVTVWEPGLAAVPVGLPDTVGMGELPPDPATIEAIDRSQREHASTVAGDGAEFARSLGLAAEPRAVPAGPRHPRREPLDAA